MKKILFIIAIAVVMTACTANQRAKNWGGQTTITINPNQKVVNATWKDSDLWILTRDMKSDEKPEQYTLTEHSGWGILNGKVTIIESIK
jgi:uncharacterized lipoprotein YajG